MAYRNIPWYCPVCNRDFKGALGKASHYSSKQHKANLEERQREKGAGEASPDGEPLSSPQQAEGYPAEIFMNIGIIVKLGGLLMHYHFLFNSWGR